MKSDRYNEQTMNEKEIIFQKEDQGHIRGILYLPDSKTQKKLPLVIIAHGYGGNYRTLQYYGPQFARKNIACLLFDFCGGGLESKSDGSMWDMSVLTELKDFEIILEQIKTIEEVNTNQVFLLGESQGGYVSALTAGRHPELIAGLILWYPAFVIEDDTKKRTVHGIPEDMTLWGLPLGKKYHEDALKIDIYSEIAKYQKQVLIIHGDCDEIVPLSYSKKAVDTYQNAKLKILTGAGHGFEGQEREDAAAASIQFIEERSKE